MPHITLFLFLGQSCASRMSSLPPNLPSEPSDRSCSLPKPDQTEPPARRARTRAPKCLVVHRAPRRPARRDKHSGHSFFLLFPRGRRQCVGFSGAVLPMLALSRMSVEGLSKRGRRNLDADHHGVHGGVVARQNPLPALRDQRCTTEAGASGHDSGTYRHGKCR